MSQRPAPSVLVVVRADPRVTHRGVEALRIALGLSTGPNPVTVVLLGDAPLLLSDDSDVLDDLVDGEILQKHLPTLKELEMPFVVARGSRSRFELDPDYRTREATMDEITRLTADADRVLVF